MQLTPEDTEALRSAKATLENPGIVPQLTNLLGGPIEKGMAMLPANWRDKVSLSTHDALQGALKAALNTMPSAADLPTPPKASPVWHQAALALTGGLGGFLGLPGMLVELPASTMLMLRSIADIARSHGEKMNTPEAQMACLSVFALGGPGKEDDAAESGYFAVRAALAAAVSDATEFIARKGVVDQAAPALVRLISAIAVRFQVQVTEKAAAMAVPIIGAVSGATINLMFVTHFQNMSQGHFTVRRLERQYGKETVRLAYESLDVSGA